MTATKRAPVTHDMAVERLAEIPWAAEKLRKWRNVDGGLGGWDDYAQAEFNSNILSRIWPEGY